MRRALELARNGFGLASPNPAVGAVVVSRDATVVGEGWHEGRGTVHAEIRALDAAGERARGGTLYVTLEPCSHQGRMGPCAPAVVRAGIARVVAAMQDPYPEVDGRGFRYLREHGVEVVVGVLDREARRLVVGFEKHVLTGLPHVVLKTAASLDGKVAARDGSSKWITGEAARLDAHVLRSASDAVIVGAGTAVADDPSLTVRLPGYRGRQPLRVLVDGRGRTSPNGRLFDDQAPTLVATTPSSPAAVREAWAATGAEVLVLDDLDAETRVPLAELIRTLGKRDVQTALIEGGPTLAAAALREDLVDALVLYFAPKLIGGDAARGVLAGEGAATIAEALHVSIVSVERIGEDVRVEADVHRDR